MLADASPSAGRARLSAVPQIHLHAEPGDYAPLVLLPGDPSRAQRIAERFDAGSSRAVKPPRGSGRKQP